MPLWLLGLSEVRARVTALYRFKRCDVLGSLIPWIDSCPSTLPGEEDVEFSTTTFGPWNFQQPMMKGLQKVWNENKLYNHSHGVAWFKSTILRQDLMSQPVISLPTFSQVKACPTDESSCIAFQFTNKTHSSPKSKHLGLTFQKNGHNFPLFFFFVLFGPPLCSSNDDGNILPPRHHSPAPNPRRPRGAPSAGPAGGPGPDSWCKKRGAFNGWT